MNKIYEAYTKAAEPKKINESSSGKAVEAIEKALDILFSASGSDVKKAVALFVDGIDNFFVDGSKYANKYEAFTKELNHTL